MEKFTNFFRHRLHLLIGMVDRRRQPAQRFLQNDERLGYVNDKQQKSQRDERHASIQKPFHPIPSLPIRTFHSLCTHLFPLSNFDIEKTASFLKQEKTGHLHHSPFPVGRQAERTARSYAC